MEMMETIWNFMQRVMDLCFLSLQLMMGQSNQSPPSSPLRPYIVRFSTHSSIFASSLIYLSCSLFSLHRLG